jgi:hypothetical protein
MTSALSHALDYSTLADRARHGGFTVAPDGREPDHGYVISPYPDRSYTAPADTITAADLYEYAGKNADLLALPDHYLGGWVDDQTGQVWLDISILAPDLPAAEVLGRAYNQLAVYDLTAGREVRL